MTEIESLRAALSDHYAIEREIGAGGMATVYLARDVKHDRLVAIKVLREELSASLGKERFLREHEGTKVKALIGIVRNPVDVISHQLFDRFNEVVDRQLGQRESTRGTLHPVGVRLGTPYSLRRHSARLWET